MIKTNKKSKLLIAPKKDRISVRVFACLRKTRNSYKTKIIATTLFVLLFMVKG